LLLTPYALAGKPWEAFAGTACLIVLAAIYLAELATPDVLISSLALGPLLVAMWTSSTAWAARVALLCVALLAVAIVIEEANRLSLVILGLTMLAIAAVTRACAQRLAELLARRPAIPFSDRSVRGVAALTRRELEVANLASNGYTAAEIAHRLHISDRTVESHIASTYERLGIHSRFELMRMARELSVLAGRERE
jgi:DNA-binding NarL/FixJ family response regulator